MDDVTGNGGDYSSLLEGSFEYWGLDMLTLFLRQQAGTKGIREGFHDSVVVS